jgi:rubrerythrin
MVLVSSQFPEITTFSSLIRFALELESAAISLYEGSTKTFPDIAALPLLAEVHQKRYQLLENTRRQKLNEMILEPIHELNRDDYRIEIRDGAGAPLNELFKMAITLEEQSARFYSDSAKVAKSLLAEASRIFQKLAKENEDNKGRLTSISV